MVHTGSPQSQGTPNTPSATSPGTPFVCPLPPPMPPRVGGGTTADNMWTGGSNLPAQQRAHPKTIYARHPEDFKDAEKVESHCCTDYLSSNTLA